MAVDSTAKTTYQPEALRYAARPIQSFGLIDKLVARTPAHSGQNAIYRVCKKLNAALPCAA